MADRTGRVIRRLPARVRTPAVARAMWAPSTFALAGAGGVVALAVGGPVVAVPVAAVVWSSRVGVAAGDLKGRRRRRRPEGAPNPYALSDPWRSLVIDARQSQKRFQRVVATVPEGPVRDRLVAIGARVDEGVDQSWRIAGQGNAIQKAVAEINRDRLAARLSVAEGDRARATVPEDRAALDELTRSLRAQLAAAGRLARTAEGARRDLSLLGARLEEAVASALEMSLSAHTPLETERLVVDVEAVVHELSTLRIALEETSRVTSDIPVATVLPEPTL